MSTATLEREVPAVRTRTAPAPIPMSRIVGVELRKMFDTRSGFWLVMSVGILAVLATAATLLFAPHDELSYGAFGGAIGMPMSVILPMIAVLAVTSEWSQRTGLTTFTLGVVIRNSPGAIVGYFVYALVLPAALGTLAAYQDWFKDRQGWVDFNYASTRLYDGNLTGTEWAHLGVSGLVWLVIPLVVGLRLVLRSEVK
jgi:hypothetical protein